MTAAENKILLTLSCPHCGGKIETLEGEDMVRCEYCDSLFMLTSDEGIGSVMYKLSIEKDTALSAFREWTKKGPKAKDLLQRAEISETYPVYLPFWRLIGRGKACVTGIEERRVNDGKITRTERIPHEALINREYIYTKIACDPGDLGVETLVVPNTAEAVLFDDQNIVTFPATKSRGTAYDEGEAAIKAQAIADGARRQDEIKFSKAFFFPSGFSMMYYPVWIIRYKYEERDYLAVVDGITSRILSGRAPGNAGSQSTAAAVGGTLAGTFAALGPIGALMMLQYNFEAESILPLFCAVGGIALAIVLLLWCFRRFRYGGEVSEGAVKGKTLNLGKKTSDVYSVPGSGFDLIN